MTPIQPLPQFLTQRYHGWKDTTYTDKASTFARLADEGQTPRAMIISCCDSRVNVTEIFGANQGDFFVHRNIASLVPPFEVGGHYHGTSAAVEYAVTVLRVHHLVVMGHSLCGGVKGCHDMCRGDAPGLENPESFVGRWIDILKPGYDKVKDLEDEGERLRAFEHEAVRRSLTNLMTYPFIAAAVAAGQLGLHGLWTDIRNGGLAQFDPESDCFVTV